MLDTHQSENLCNFQDVLLPITNLQIFFFKHLDLHLIHDKVQTPV